MLYLTFLKFISYCRLKFSSNSGRKVADVISILYYDNGDADDYHVLYFYPLSIIFFACLIIFLKFRQCYVVSSDSYPEILRICVGLCSVSSFNPGTIFCRIVFPCADLLGNRGICMNCVSEVKQCPTPQSPPSPFVESDMTEDSSNGWLLTFLCSLWLCIQFFSNTVTVLTFRTPWTTLCPKIW